MVSGLVTSPCDQLRIFSGEAREMRIASKSVMGLLSSNGLERYKTTLLGTWRRIDSSKRMPAAFPEFILLGPSCPSRERLLRDRGLKNFDLKNVILFPISSVAIGNAGKQKARRPQSLARSAAAVVGTGCFFSPCLISSTSRQSDCSSRIKTLNDSGTPGSIAASPLTMAS